MKRARRTQLVLAFLAQFSIVMSSALEARVQVQPSTPKLENDLRRAAERGEVKLVQDLANAGVNVNAPDNRGRTALHLASMKGEAAVIAALLGTANIDATDSDGRTPLMLAADGAHLAVVRLLVARGAQLETKDRRGVTALGLARSRSADVSAEIQSAIEKQRAKEEGERYLALLGQSQEYNAARRKLLSRYRTGTTTLQEFDNDQWDAGAPAIARVGILSFERLELFLNARNRIYTLGMLDPASVELLSPEKSGFRIDQMLETFRNAFAFVARGNALGKFSGDTMRIRVNGKPVATTSIALCTLVFSDDDVLRTIKGPWCSND